MAKKPAPEPASDTGHRREVSTPRVAKIHPRVVNSLHHLQTNPLKYQDEHQRRCAGRKALVREAVRRDPGTP